MAPLAPLLQEFRASLSMNSENGVAPTCPTATRSEVAAVSSGEGAPSSKSRALGRRPELRLSLHSML